MTPENNPIGWVEIPALDMDRAIAFYNAVFGYDLQTQQVGPLLMAFMPMSAEGKGSAAALVKFEQWYKPTLDGPLVYFTAPSGDLRNKLARVEPAGGHIAVPRKPISEEFGFIACIVDTEENRIALHSRK